MFAKVSGMTDRAEKISMLILKFECPSTSDRQKM